MTMEGCHGFHKTAANTSAAVIVPDCRGFSRLTTEDRVRLTAAPVIWNTKPHQVRLHSSELDRVPGSGVA